MTHQAERTGIIVQKRQSIVLSYLLVGVIALLLRVVDLGAFVTIDEAKFWVPRSDAFLQALQTGDYAAIPVVGHPGVTTMWLGSAGIALRRALFEGGLLQQETYPVLLTLHRLPTALVHVAGMLVGYALLRRLFAASVALLAAVLWATDPFVLAFSRVLHVDGLATTFATLSLLAACVCWNHRRHTGWLIFSACCAGLAVLSKLPALVVLPIVGMLALQSAWSEAQERGWLRSLAPLTLWGAVFLATVAALWPLAWVDPLRLVQAVRYGIESEGGQPHLWGNFFLGHAVEVPGWRFYPVALALRMTPWAMVGVLLLPMALVRRREWAKERWTKNKGHPLLHSSFPILHSPTVLAGFIVLFVLAMSLFPKKMNRYLVPVFPSVNVLAAVGLGAWRGKGQEADPPPDASRFSPYALALIGPVALVNAWWFHPYSVMYGNQALGGAPAIADTFLAGWGEGFAQVADYLNEQPDSDSTVTVTELRSVLQPYLNEGVYATSDEEGRLPDSAGYLVIYRSHIQRGLSPPYHRFHRHAPPLHIVTLHGVDYAWIYDVPQDTRSHLAATFGPSLTTQGYEVETDALRSTGVLTLTIQWQARAPVPTDYHLFVHVFDGAGQQVGQLDVPLLDPHMPTSVQPAPTSAWQPGRFVRWVHPVPIEAAGTGPYWISLGLSHPADFSRVPLQVSGARPSQPGAPDDGPETLMIGPIVLE